MLLLTMMRGLYDQGIRNELLFHSADIDIDAAIAFIEEREVEPSSSTDDEVHTPDSADGGSPSVTPDHPEHLLPLTLHHYTPPS